VVPHHSAKGGRANFLLARSVLVTNLFRSDLTYIERRLNVIVPQRTGKKDLMNKTLASCVFVSFATCLLGQTAVQQFKAEVPDAFGSVLPRPAQNPENS
jgi:hypothetical protein